MAQRRCAPLLPQACRNYAKAVAAAKEQGMAEGTYTVMHLDLASLDSVRHPYPPGSAALSIGHLSVWSPLRMPQVLLLPPVVLRLVQTVRCH